jgi:hypothetical protein
MKPHPHHFSAAAAVLLACLTGCGASDGGPIGTGITASVVGNVVTSQPVEVSIDGVAGAATRTDADGSFEIDGAFSGLVRLRFETAGVDVAQDIVVPSGSVVALTDITLSPSGVDVGAARQLDVFAEVQSVDCGAGQLDVRELAQAGEIFAVSLGSDTAIEQRDGTPASCADIATGSIVAIDGAFTPGDELTLTALRVTLRPDQSAQHAPVRAVPFLGHAVSVDCATGSLVIDDEAGPSQLSLDDATIIERPNHNPLACSDIHVGDQITGVGNLRLRQPGVIQATDIVVTRRTRTDIELRFAGRLGEIDCRTGLLQIVRHNAVIAVRLLPDTIVLPPTSCDGLTLTAWVTGVGRVGPEGSSVLDAVRLRVKTGAGS